MATDTVFLSFTRILDPARHRDYNAWHQLDHRPENLALPGVRYGERWVNAPAGSRSAPVARELLQGLHYLNAYWFEEPSESSVRAWQHLAEESLDQGRRPDLHWAERLLMGFFEQVDVRVNRRLALSREALPLRPSRGVHLLVEEIAHPRSAAAEERNRWDRAERLARVADCDGVAGVCALVSTSTTLDPPPDGAGSSSTLLVSPGAQRGRLRVLLTFLDGDPQSLERELRDLERAGAATAQHPSVTHFQGVLQTIAPWEWSWFDDAPDGDTA